MSFISIPVSGVAPLIESQHEGALPGTITQGILLSSFLISPALEIIAETIEHECYDQKTPRQHYPAMVMLKLLAIKCFRKLLPAPNRISFMYLVEELTKRCVRCQRLSQSAV